MTSKHLVKDHNKKFHINTGCGEMGANIKIKSDGTIRIIVQMGKSGGCTCSQAESIGRVINLGFKSGVKVEDVIKELSGIRCPSPMIAPVIPNVPVAKDDNNDVLSCGDAVAKLLQMYVNLKKEVKEDGKK